MGSINKGILGGFSGTVGTVIGGSWRGIDYMRSRPTIRNSSSTQAQLEQRAKFSVATKFFSVLQELLTVGFRKFAVKMTGTNSALSENLKNVIIGSFPNFSIDYSKVLITKGKLPNVAAPVVASPSAGSITFTWTDNSGEAKALASDKAILIAYCESLNHVSYSTNGGLRGDSTGTLDVPSLSGRIVQTYIAFISVDGKFITNSLYIGPLTVS